MRRSREHRSVSSASSSRRGNGRHAARQLVQLPRFVRNLALKALLTAGLGTALRRLGHRAPEWPY